MFLEFTSLHFNIGLCGTNFFCSDKTNYLSLKHLWAFVNEETRKARKIGKYARDEFLFMWGASPSVKAKKQIPRHGFHSQNGEQ